MKDRTFSPGTSIRAVAGALARVIPGGRRKPSGAWAQHQLEQLARRHELSPGGGQVPAFVRDRAAWFEGQEHARVRVAELLVGRDDSGAFYIGRREIAGHEHHFLLCELANDRGLGRLSLRTTPLDEGKGEQVQLDWQPSRAAAGDAALRDCCHRLVALFAEHAPAAGQLPLVATLRGRQLVVHSQGAVDPRRRDEFLRSVKALRECFLEGLRRERPYGGHSGPLGPLAGAGSGFAVARDDPAVEEALSALDETAAHTPIDAWEMVRESRAVKPLSRRRTIYGIPEAGDEVEVLTGRGRS